MKVAQKIKQIRLCFYKFPKHTHVLLANNGDTDGKLFYGYKYLNSTHSIKPNHLSVSYLSLQLIQLHRKFASHN